MVTYSHTYAQNISALITLMGGDSINTQNQHGKAKRVKAYMEEHILSDLNYQKTTNQNTNKKKLKLQNYKKKGGGGETITLTY